ncbi:MAG: AbrB/MazE/SpoVT family DNA-binding domain-containing protein [Allorhizobium sp.]
MNVTIRKIGNSEGIIIPKEVLDRLGLKAGDTLDIREEQGGFLIKAQDEEFARQIQSAEKFMDKYKVALKKLAE